MFPGWREGNIITPCHCDVCVTEQPAVLVRLYKCTLTSMKMRAWNFIVWLVLFVVQGSLGLTGPNCEVQTSRQLTATDQSVNLRNQFTLLKIATRIFQEIESLGSLGYKRYQNSKK